jgi:hypothetical protein
MLIRVLLFTASLILAAGGAQAGHCPQDIAKIDKALASANLQPSQSNAVITLRNTGERLHKAGRHADSVKTLAGAIDMLKKLGVRVD